MKYTMAFVTDFGTIIFADYMRHMSGDQHMIPAAIEKTALYIADEDGGVLKDNLPEGTEIPEEVTVYLEHVLDQSAQIRGFQLIPKGGW